MDDLVTWLRAQIDEDERMARACEVVNGLGHLRGWVELQTPEIDVAEAFLDRHGSARVLREVESKRRLIEQIGYYESKIDGEWGCCHDGAAILAGRCPEIEVGEIAALRILALPYADRPGYRGEWKP